MTEIVPPPSAADIERMARHVISTQAAFNRACEAEEAARKAKAHAQMELEKVSTWSGLRVCAGNTVESAARAALKRIRKGMRAGRDLPSALSIQSGIANQLPVMPLRPEWFALPEQIAAFGKDGQIVLDAIDYIERGLLLCVRRGNGVLDACGSISHVLFEPRRDPAAELAPWGTVGAETDTGAHRADLADQIMGLQQWTTITDRPPTETDGDRRGLVLAMRRWHGGYRWEVMRWQGAALLGLRWTPLPEVPESE